MSYKRVLIAAVVLSACSQDWSRPQRDAGGPAPDAEVGPSGSAHGGFVIVSEPRVGPRSNGSLVLTQDGFELGPATCDSRGRCLTGSFTP